MLRWLHRAGANRFRFRLLQGLAISLAVNQCVLLWLGQIASGGHSTHVRWLASTVFWTVGLGLFAGWVMLGGWFDQPTRTLLGQFAQRRGYSRGACLRFEVVAGWRWLALWLAVPCIACSLVADLRARTISALWASFVNLAIALLFVEVIATAIVMATVALRKFEPRRARWIWIWLCVLPELVRPILPGFPTLRALATAVEQIILRWGVAG